MTLALRPLRPGPVPTPAPSPARQTLRQWRQQRAEVEHAKALAARRTVLGHVAQRLEQTAELLEHGWVQGVWHTVQLPHGPLLGVGPAQLHLLGRGPVVGSCLVGAVVQAADGAAHAASATRRTLDVLWEVLEHPRSAGLPEFARVCPPVERAGRVRQLTRWNDTAGRSRAEVLGLVEAGRSRALQAASS